MMVTDLKVWEKKLGVIFSKFRFQIRALIFVSPFGDTFLVNSFEIKSPFKQNAISKSSNRSLCVRMLGFIIVRLEKVFILDHKSDIYSANE